MLTAEYETWDGLKIEISDHGISLSQYGVGVDISNADFEFILLKHRNFQEAKKLMDSTSPESHPLFNNGW